MWLGCSVPKPTWVGTKTHSRLQESWTSLFVERGTVYRAGSHTLAETQVFTGREESGPRFYEEAGVTTRASWNWRRKAKKVLFFFLNILPCCGLCWFVLLKVTAGIEGHDPKLTPREFSEGRRGGAVCGQWYHTGVWDTGTVSGFTVRDYIRLLAPSLAMLCGLGPRTPYSIIFLNHIKSGSFSKTLKKFWKNADFWLPRSGPKQLTF